MVARNVCFLNIHVESEAPPFNDGDKRLGIDLGINILPVCSDNSFLISKHWKKVMIIDSSLTSQACSRCAHISRSNRNGRQFACIQCGFSLDADLNAARNIAIFSIRDDVMFNVNKPNVAGNDVEALKRIETKPGCTPSALGVVDQRMPL